MVTFHRVAVTSRPRTLISQQTRRMLLGSLAFVRLIVVMALMMLALTVLNLLSQLLRRTR